LYLWDRTGKSMWFTTSERMCSFSTASRRAKRAALAVLHLWGDEDPEHQGPFYRRRPPPNDRPQAGEAGRGLLESGDQYRQAVARWCSQEPEAAPVLPQDDEGREEEDAVLPALRLVGTGVEDHEPYGGARLQEHLAELEGVQRGRGKIVAPEIEELDPLRYGGCRLPDRAKHHRRGRAAEGVSLAIGWRRLIGHGGGYAGRGLLSFDGQAQIFYPA